MFKPLGVSFNSSQMGEFLVKLILLCFAGFSSGSQSKQIFNFVTYHKY